MNAIRVRRRVGLHARARAPFSLRSARLYLVATMCALAPACSDGDGSRPAGSAPDASAAPPASAVSATGAPRDACELIPVERIAAIVGAQVVTASDPGPRESSCSYTDESGQFPYVELTVYWTEGRQMLEVVGMGTALAAGMMAEPGDEAIVDSILRPGPVAGLGDTALFSDIMPSYVLTGDVLLEMMMPLLPDPRQHFRSLASTALARL